MPLKGPIQPAYLTLLARNYSVVQQVKKHEPGDPWIERFEKMADKLVHLLISEAVARGEDRHKATRRYAPLWQAMAYRKMSFSRSKLMFLFSIRPTMEAHQLMFFYAIHCDPLLK